jgi:hypothetical protein
MTQATPEVRPSSAARKTNPFEPSLAVNDLESAIGLVCGATDAIWHYAQFSDDTTLQYLIDMVCMHAGALRTSLYEKRTLHPSSACFTVNEMEEPVGNVYDGAYALWDYAQGPDDTLPYLAGMLCSHASALKAIIYPDEVEEPCSRQPN